ncbi:hypothetical protein [Sinomicrobium sp. M5D2P17]
MRSLRLYAILFMVIAMAIACNTKPSKEAEAYNKLFDEVITVHDEIMPAMGKLNSLSKRLKQEADSTNSSGVLDSLEMSHKAMMDWMKDFSEKFPYGEFNPKDKTPEEITAKVNILEEEKNEVYELHELINQSMEKAEKLLNAK